MILAEEMNERERKNKNNESEICDVSIFIQPFHTFSSQEYTISNIHNKSNHVGDSFNTNAE